MAMMKPMTAYKIETPKVEQHSFVKVRTGEVYAENGNVKTYSNKTQAEKRAAMLNDLGFRCAVSLSWPYTIRPLF